MIYTPMVETQYLKVLRSYRKQFRQMAKSHNEDTIRSIKEVRDLENKAEAEYKKIASIDLKIRKYEDERIRIYSQASIPKDKEQERYHIFPQLRRIEYSLENLRQERIVHEEVASINQGYASLREKSMCLSPHLYSYRKVKFEYDGLVDRVRDFFRI